MSEADPLADAIRFDDGAAYERYMGKWSRLAGESFLDWLAPAKGGRWLDIGRPDDYTVPMPSSSCSARCS